MSYQLDAKWLVIGTGLYVLICVIGFFAGIVAIAVSEDDAGLYQEERMSDKAIFATCLATGIIAALLVTNGIGWLSTGGAGGQTAGAASATSVLGLNSGQSYPVAIGRSVDGSIGQAYAYGGLFSSEAHISLQPGSSISMNFQSGSMSYILQIPVSKVTFRQTSSSSRVTFFIKNSTINPDGSTADYGSFKNHCKPIVKSVVLTASCTSTFVMNDATKRRGLAPLVANNLDSASIQLSPKLYQRILGTP